MPDKISFYCRHPEPTPEQTKVVRIDAALYDEVNLIAHDTHISKIEVISTLLRFALDRTEIIKEKK